VFCPSCGKPNDQDARFCSSCGAEFTVVARRRAQTTSPGPAQPAAEAPDGVAHQDSSPGERPATKSGQPSPRVSGTWWLMPVFLGWLGGLIAWLINKEKEPKKARSMLITGIVVSVALAALWTVGALVLGLLPSIAGLAQLARPAPGTPAVQVQSDSGLVTPGDSTPKAKRQARRKPKREERRQRRDERRRRTRTGSSRGSHSVPRQLQAIVTDAKGERFAVIDNRRYHSGDRVEDRTLILVETDVVMYEYKGKTHTARIGEQLH